jgi:hypothetical protein
MKERNMNKQIQAALASYARTAVSAGLGMYMSGHSDAKSIGFAALGAVAGPLLRALNKNDSAFGIGAAK